MLGEMKQRRVHDITTSQKLLSDHKIDFFTTMHLLHKRVERRRWPNAARSQDTSCVSWIAELLRLKQHDNQGLSSSRPLPLEKVAVSPVFHFRLPRRTVHARVAA